jgi:integrase
MGLADLVREPILQHFISHLQGEDLKPSTQADYLNGIWLTARALAPKGNWAWIGHGVTALRAEIRKPSLVEATDVSTDQLVALGKQLFADAATRCNLPDWARAGMARDGLIIAFLALRPIRRKNLAALTLGRHILVEPAGGHIVIPANEMKMGKRPYHADWPDMLADELHQYMREYRPALLNRYTGEYPWPPAGDAFWVSERGTRLDDSAIDKRVRKLTKAALGEAINLHRFRHLAAGTIAMQQPDMIHVVTPLLGHHNPRTREFYIQADQLSAVRRSHACEDQVLDTEANRTRRTPGKRPIASAAPERPQPGVGSASEGRQDAVSDFWQHGGHNPCPGSSW